MYEVKVTFANNEEAIAARKALREYCDLLKGLIVQAVKDEAFDKAKIRAEELTTAETALEAVRTGIHSNAAQ